MSKNALLKKLLLKSYGKPNRKTQNFPSSEYLRFSFMKTQNSFRIFQICFIKKLKIELVLKILECFCFDHMATKILLLKN